MEGQELRDGKERVQALLIGPLERRGMKRGPSVTVADHAAMMESLRARLAYMNEASLLSLSEVIERHAGGKAKTLWPSEVSICNWARRLQEPPVSESRLVRSYLQSAAGLRARDGGYLVELFLELKKLGLPPNRYALTQIKRAADDNRRRLALIARDEARGGAAMSDLEWRAGYLDLQRRCLDIVVAKETEGVSQ